MAKGCNCKRGNGTLNNLNVKTYIEQAKFVVETIIDAKPIEDLTDLDKVEIMGVYALLYPNSATTPSLEEAIIKIKEGIDRYTVKYKR